MALTEVKAVGSQTFTRKEIMEARRKDVAANEYHYTYRTGHKPSGANREDV